MENGGDRGRKESIRETESVHFCEEVDCIEYTPSVSSQVTEEIMMDDVDGDADDDVTTIDDYQFSDTASNFHRRFSGLLVKTWRERLGEHCVRCSCTAMVGLALMLSILIAVVGIIKVVVAIYHWRSCPRTADLPMYLLVSGLTPCLFYITCRTRRKHEGKAPETQRIVGRWRFSAFPCTLDTERSWQAGLAGVLSFFLLGWLIYGTILVVIATQRLELRPPNCSLPPAVRLTRFNATSSRLTSLTSSASSRLTSLSQNSSFFSTGRHKEHRNNSTKMTEQLPSSSSSSSSASSSSSSSSSTPTSKRPPPVASPSPTSSSSSLFPFKTNSSKTGKPHRSQALAAADRHAMPTDATNSSDVMGGAMARSEVNLTSVGEGERCEECERGFVTWCWGLVLFDWMYMAALVLNVLVLGTVPCCCYVGVDA